MLQYFQVVLDGNGEFPVEDLKRELGENPLMILHPARGTPTFVVCDSEESVAYRVAQFQADPDTPFDTSGMISLERQAITIFLPGIVEIHDQIKDFLIPVLETYPCSIGDEYGEDHTERFRGRETDLFGS